MAELSVVRASGSSDAVVFSVRHVKVTLCCNERQTVSECIHKAVA